MSDIADVLNRLNELGRDDLAEVVTCLMGERDNLAVRLSESETGELKNALAVGKAVLELSEARREADDLRAQLSEAQERLAEIDRHAPPCILANRCEALTTAPVPPAAVAAGDYWLDGRVIRKGSEYVAELISQETLLLRELLTGKLKDKPAAVAEVAEKWAYCPECGHESSATRGCRKQCENCGQEWFSDIDYSDVVRTHLSGRYSDKDAEIARLKERIAATPAPIVQKVPAGIWMREFIDAVEREAFKIRAPNTHTPVLIGMCNEARRKLFAAAQAQEGK